ncbi:MAG: PD-(D/E)XK nuclease family transposase [Longibaculum sp.]
MHMENQLISSFCSDYFFHYLLYNCEEARILIAKHLSHYPIQYTHIETPEEYPINNQLKKMILDVVFTDQFGRLYNVEMQNKTMTRTVLIRFISYAAKLLEREIKKGGDYNVDSIKCLVIYTGTPIKHFEHFSHHLEFMDSDYCIKIEEGPICIEIIQTQRMEELNMEMTFQNEFEQFIYLFEDEENHKKEQLNPLCKNVVKLYEDYLNSDQLLAYYQHERDLRVIQTEIHNAKNEGIMEAKLENAKTLISNIYHIDDFEWLDSCTLEQLDYIISIITNGYTYEDLKKQVLKEKNSQF